MKRVTPYLAGLGFASIFGLSFLFTKAALDEMDFLRLLAFRFFVAAAAITILRLVGLLRVNLRGRPVQQIIAVAAFQPIAYFLFETNGVMRSSTSRAGMMLALIPIAVTILSRFVLGERQGFMQLLCIAFSVSGVVVVASQNSLQGENTLAGALFLLGAVISAALYNVLSRRSAREFSPIEITYVMMWTGAIVFNVLSLLSHWVGGNMAGYLEPLSRASVWYSLLYLGVMSSVLAFFLVNFAISRLPVAQAAVFANLVTVVSIAAGVLIRGEDFSAGSLLGATMIIGGVFGTNYFSRRTDNSGRMPAADVV